MSGISKRSVREAEKREERLYYMFIAKYIEGLHRNVYNQAKDFYQKVRYKNPRVRDLTKTKEFMETITPNTTIPRYYTSKQREHLIRRDPPQQDNNMSRMVLNIQLMEVPPQTSTVQPLPPSLPQDDVSPLHPETSTVQPLPPSLPQDDVSPLHPETSTVQPLPPSLPQDDVSPLHPETSTVQPLPPSLPQDDVSPLHPETSTVQPLPPSLPQDDVSPLHPDVYKTLLDGLRSDPDLWKIFNDFQDDPDGMDGLVAEDMCDVFTVDDTSELELAVEAIF